MQEKQKKIEKELKKKTKLASLPRSGLLEDLDIRLKQDSRPLLQWQDESFLESSASTLPNSFFTNLDFLGTLPGHSVFLPFTNDVFMGH